MKKILFVLGLAVLSSQAFAGIDETDLSIAAAMKKLVSEHNESAGIRELKAKIESEYGVTCVGDSSTVFPEITKKVTYRAACKGSSTLELKIVSKFSNTESGFSYSVNSYSVSF